MLRIFVWIKDTFNNLTITHVVLGGATIFIALIIFGSIVSILRGPELVVPSCQEDELIVGINSFDNGYWSEYICVHPDIIFNGE